jgi:hypothetical protein
MSSLNSLSNGMMQLDIYLLSQKWKELVKKARAKQLKQNEYSSGMEPDVSVL